jgi:biopolymer transport protein ExbD
MAATGAEGEPDLTAMLDVVMQLLMYFIMCVNLEAEQVNEDVKLPPSQAAMAMVNSGEEVLFVNVNRKGEVLVLGQPPMNIGEAKLWLENRALEAKGRSKKGEMPWVVLRADRAASYADVFQVLQRAKGAGFKRFKVRAEIVGSGGAALAAGGAH